MGRPFRLCGVALIARHRRPWHDALASGAAVLHDARPVPMLRRLFHLLERLVNAPVFSVTLGANGARASAGSPPAAWLADCSDLAREFGLASGRIDALRVAGRMQLRFSPDVPASLHQRFRNVFATHVSSRG